jgi:hypothetical protein
LDSNCSSTVGVLKNPRAKNNSRCYRRYRHRSGVKCGCVNRSVRREIFEHDFARLLSLLSIDEQYLHTLLELSNQLTLLHQGTSGDALEAEKIVAIARLHRKLDAARNLYQDGDLSREEYLRRKDTLERDLRHW